MKPSLRRSSIMRYCLSAALIATPVIALASPAEAAPLSTSSYYVKYGNSITKGTVDWYNRSVAVYDGVQKAASGCRRTYLGAVGGTNGYGHDQTDPVCAPNSAAYTLKATVDVVGGPTLVVIHLDDSNSGTTLAKAYCYRNTRTCQPG